MHLLAHLLHKKTENNWFDNSSLVVDHFQTQLQSTHGIGHIYFDYKEQDNQKPAQVLASLIKQLLSQTLQLPAEVDNLYKKLKRHGKKPSIEELYTLLLVAARLFPRVFFVFDALDECHPENQRRVLLPLFQKMGNDGINLFLTSRPHPQDIQDSLKDTVKIELSAQEQDIVIYIQEKINENPRARGLVEQARCKDIIVSELVNCAKGM